MKFSINNQIKFFSGKILFIIIFILAACTATDVETKNPEPTATHPAGISENTPMETITEIPEPTSTLIHNTPVIETMTPVTEQVIPDQVKSENFDGESAFLKGPLVGYRNFDDQGDFVAILDIGNANVRQVRGKIDHPFGDLWYGDGCQIYTSQGLVNLNGDIVWQKPDLDWEILLSPEGAYNEVTRLSPDGKWLAYNILYGEQYYEDAEFTDIGIVNLADSSNPQILTADGKAYTFAWSPDSQWLAFKHVDEDGLTQLFRTSPDGDVREQLTFHTEKIGIQYIVWSPNGRYVAYAGYQSKDQGETGIGWVDIVDTSTNSLYQVSPTESDFGGITGDNIWWSLDETRLVFAGREWQNFTTTTHIYWVDIESGSIFDSFFAADFPEGPIDEVHAVGSVDQLLLRTNEDFYLFDALDKSYKQIPIDVNFVGPQVDSESAPFNFPGEDNCQKRTIPSP